MCKTIDEFGVIQQQIAELESANANDNGVNYAYAFGWLTGTLNHTLLALNLTDEQMQILQKRGALDMERVLELKAGTALTASDQLKQIG